MNTPSSMQADNTSNMPAGEQYPRPTSWTHLACFTNVNTYLLEAHHERFWMPARREFQTRNLDDLKDALDQLNIIRNEKGVSKTEKTRRIDELEVLLTNIHHELVETWNEDNHPASESKELVENVKGVREIEELANDLPERYSARLRGVAATLSASLQIYAAGQLQRQAAAPVVPQRTFRERRVQPEPVRGRWARFVDSLKSSK